MRGAASLSAPSLLDARRPAASIAGMKKLLLLIAIVALATLATKKVRSV
jgi:hypothetical protein